MKRRDLIKSLIVSLVASLALLVGVIADSGFVIDPYRFVSPYLVQDTFTDSNGTALADHMPDVDVVGDGWIARNGNADIQNNQANLTANPATPRNILTIETNVADVEIKDTMTLYADLNFFVFRYVDNDNFWFIGDATGTSKFSITERTGGSNINRDTTGAGSTGSHEYITTLNGTSISCDAHAENVSYGSATSHQSATDHGIGGKLSTYRHDDFSVEAL